MRTHLDCVPCFVRQTLSAARALGLGEQDAAALLRDALELLVARDWTLPPPVIGRDLHRLIRQRLGDPDPFLPRKREHTAWALALLPELERQVAASPWPFRAAVRLAIAGNVIDLGAGTGWTEETAAWFREDDGESVDGAAVERLEREVAAAGEILFLADNAGEIVLDRPLLERLGPERVTVAVRGGPTINDATRDDAVRSGLTERFTVIDNGSDAPGTHLPDCSPAFVERFAAADLVIAKGQGNFETLDDAGRAVWFLFLVKCPLPAEQLAVPLGTHVVRCGG